MSKQEPRITKFNKIMQKKKTISKFKIQIAQGQVPLANELEKQTDLRLNSQMTNTVRNV